MHDYKQYNQQLKRLCQRLVAAKQRQLVVLFGSQPWCYQFANQLPLSDCFVFSNDNRLNHQQFPQHTHQILGQEFSHAIYDGFSGLYPNKLAALSGTVKAGGLFILILPDAASRKNWQDPALSAVVSHGQKCSHSYFNQRFFALISKQNIICINQYKGFTKALDSSALSLTKINLQPQQTCVEQIIKTTHGRANRPLVISADRGRGKSAALGLAAAQLADKKILLCATQSRAVQTSFKHLAEHLNLSLQKNTKQLANLTYIAPDTLINNKPTCDLLLVDEAAAIPVPMLMEILHSYPRVVFASTMVGYEGNGRGYTLRFLQYLKQQYKSLKHITLDEPIRFAANDPLEQHLRQLLALDASYDAKPNDALFEFSQVSQKQLINNEQQLRQVVALLALAHYQTSVDDLRHFLDAPEQRLFLCTQQQQVRAVCLIAVEGGLDDQPLAMQIMRGLRRPQGHLMTQTLAQLSLQPDILGQHNARIIRIAVAPEYQQQKIATQLLSYCQQQLNDIAFFGASFGANSALLSFWQQNGFNVVKLGYQRDKATGEHAALVIKPQNNCSRAFLKTLQWQFQEDFSLSLMGNFQQLSWQLVATLFKGFQSNDLDINDITRLKKVMTTEFTLLTIQPLLWRIIWRTPNSFNLCDEDTKNIIVRLILQQYSTSRLSTELGLAGKKAVNQTFIKAVKGWYAQFLTLKNNYH
ncbi:GNAT family N-acetyltransferase [Pseudoalteromonas mariniglutinosa]|uniref:GNAT family N-acetyltransferase n=1 Tax=Pseudoalteromonas mariniglutinosa TaxID=206042 RepID=UPI00384E77BE